MSTQLVDLPEVVRRSELTVFDSAPIAAEQMKRNMSCILDVMSSIMVEDLHYGVIPGTGTKDKPGKRSLYKPGAEVLCMTFRLIAHFEHERVELQNGHIEVRTLCTLKTPDGVVMGNGAGSCTTMETRYRYRKGERLCPACGKPTIIQSTDWKTKDKDGWLCFAKKGGCGAKFPLGAKQIEEQVVGRIENTDIADLYNTVLKMSEKRAHVDATIRTTACSSIFTQDVEDLPDYLLQVKPSAEAPKAEAAPKGPVVALDNPWLHKVESERWPSAKGRHLVDVHSESKTALETVTKPAYIARLTENDVVNIRAALKSIKDGTSDNLIDAACTELQDELPEFKSDEASAHLEVVTDDDGMIRDVQEGR